MDIFHALLCDLLVINYTIIMAIDIDRVIERLPNLPTESEIKEITLKTREILVNEVNIVNISSPCVVVGDLHGYLTTLPYHYI
jgi:ribosomal protein L7Ae-like RNA K-turn-binding protein